MYCCFEIIVPKLDNTASLDLLFQNLALVPANCNELHLNFQDVAWITPSGLLTLTLITRYWLQNSRVIVFKEVSSNILAYLERVDFFRTFPEGVALSPFCKSFEQFKRALHSNQLLEITPLPSVSLLNAQAQALLLRRAKGVLMNSFAEKAKSVEKLLTIIAEIAGNIPHSQKEGYCAMQTYVRDRRAIIHMAIADLGIGIRGSLSQTQSSELSTDLDFIQYALKPGTTSKMETRGLGLTGVYDSIKGLSGLFRIRSGTASVLLQGGTRKTFENLFYVPGTQVEIIVRE